VVCAMREFRATKIWNFLSPMMPRSLSKLEEKIRKGFSVYNQSTFTIRKLLRYDPIRRVRMNPEVATLKQNWTVAKALENLRNYHKKSKTFSIYTSLKEKISS
jgi:Mg/Co/Ni transporter MgtE